MKAFVFTQRAAKFLAAAAIQLPPAGYSEKKASSMFFLVNPANIMSNSPLKANMGIKTKRVAKIEEQKIAGPSKISGLLKLGHSQPGFQEGNILLPSYTFQTYAMAGGIKAIKYYVFQQIWALHDFITQ